MEYKSTDELLSKAKEAENHTFENFDIHDKLSSKGNKGSLGQIIEEGLFGYDINSNNEADFADLGVELKVTPVKILKNNSLAAKERLVLNIINYLKEVNFTFETSSFWRKNKNILMMFYLWQEGQERKDYRILKSILYTYPEEDLEVIKNDWEIIVNKIRAGKAHELSEGDTMYLGACTKGATNKTIRIQPFSDIPAKQRAFSLKSSYMTTLVRKYVDNEKVVSFTNSNELKTKTLEDVLYERFEPYIGLTVAQISNKLNYDINPANKSTIANMISSLLGIKGTKLDDIEEFAKANIQFKTIRLEPNGIPKEHMSFENIDFEKWLKLDFEESQIYEKFEQTKFLFIVFAYNETKSQNPNREAYLKRVLLWNMPLQTIENEVKEMWERGRKILEEGVILKETPRGISNNLPKATENSVTHIRPKARNAADTVKLPDGLIITKQTYWLNREYIGKIVNKKD